MTRIKRIFMVPLMAMMGCDGVDTETRAQPVEAMADDDAEVDALDEGASGDLQGPREAAEAPPYPPDALLVSGAEEWQYFKRTYDCYLVPDPTWRTATGPLSPYWKTGRAELGYGEYDEQTVIPAGGPSSSKKCITQYFRHEFYVEDPALFSSLIIQLLRDDGAVVYINGYEVRRDNLPAYPYAIVDKTLALYDVAGNEENKFIRTVYPPPASPYLPLPLVAGTNVIAVEVHQRSAGSNDLGFNLELLGVLKPSYTRQTVTFGSEEATIDEGKPYYNFGDGDCKADGASNNDNTGKDQACLVQWDLAYPDPYYPIPAGAVIQAAHLAVNITNNTPERFQVYPIVLSDGTPGYPYADVDWSEEAVTWSDPNDLYGMTVPGDWTGGGKFGLNTLDYPVSLVHDAFYEGKSLTIPLPAALVEEWLAYPDSADGLGIFNTKNKDGVDFEGDGYMTLVVSYDTYAIP